MNYKNVYSKIRKNILILLLIFLLIITLGTCIIKFLFGKYINTKIKTIVEENVYNLTTEEEKIQTLSKWFKENIDYARPNDTFFNLLRFSLCKIPPEITFIMKKGRCGEWAMFYLKLLNYTNITGRVVNFVEDHAIVEVLINDTYVPVEPPIGLYSYDYYKNFRNISKAYAIDESGKINDVTIRYADTGFITIKVKKEGMFIPNVKVCVLSKYLMLIDPKNYKTKLSFCNFTNEFGVHIEELGEGIYRIEALRFISPFQCQTSLLDDYILLPNRINEITLEVKEENPFSCFTKFIIENFNKLFF